MSDNTEPNSAASQAPEDSSEHTPQPQIAYEPYYNSPQSEVPSVVQAKRSQIFTATVKSFFVGVLFGILIPLFLTGYINQFIETLSPSQQLPVMGEDPSTYNGAVDLTSPQNFADQILAKLTGQLVVLWVIALIYLFPIIYQIRTAVIYGKISQVFCLAITLLGPPAVLIILPLIRMQIND